MVCVHVYVPCKCVFEFILGENNGTKLKQDEIDNLNRSIAGDIIELPLTIINKSSNIKKSTSTWIH